MCSFSYINYTLIKLFFLSQLKGSEDMENGERGCQGASQDQNPSAV